MMITIWYSNMAMENRRSIDDFHGFPTFSHSNARWVWGFCHLHYGAHGPWRAKVPKPSRYMTKLSIKREVGLFHRQVPLEGRDDSGVSSFNNFNHFNVGWNFLRMEDIPQHLGGLKPYIKIVGCLPPINSGFLPLMMIPGRSNFFGDGLQSRGLLYSAASTALYPDAPCQGSWESGCSSVSCRLVQLEICRNTLQSMVFPMEQCGFPWISCKDSRKQTQWACKIIISTTPNLLRTSTVHQCTPSSSSSKLTVQHTQH